jgi:hypothetical protein
VAVYSYIHEHKCSKFQIYDVFQSTKSIILIVTIRPKGIRIFIFVTDQESLSL